MAAQDIDVPRPRRATLKDVAEALGVSIATVSNAFNRPDQLSPALRERVLAEAARRGLSGPDAAARSLRRGRSVAVGVIYTDRLSFAFSDPGAVLFLQGVSSACEDSGHELVLISQSSTASVAGTAVGRSVVDGIVVYSVADDDPVLAAAVDRRLPVVVVDQPRTGGLPWVGTDDEQGCRAICEHVLSLGHRRLGVICTEIDRQRTGGRVSVARQDSAAFAATAARLRGYRRAAEAAGLSWSRVPVREAVENSEEQGYAAARALLKAKVRPTALLAMTDQLALGALRAAHDLGIAVPGELSVAGFDDIPEAARHHPPLSTVHQGHHDKGRLATELLLDLLAGRSPEPVSHPLPFELRVRGSTAAPPETSLSQL